MAPADSPAPGKNMGLHRVFWRVHFWAGLITAPLVLFAAFTGLLYVFTPQIEARVHADVDRVPVGAARAPLDAQLTAARAVMDGAPARAIVPAFEVGTTTQVFFAAPPSSPPRRPHDGGRYGPRPRFAARPHRLRRPLHRAGGGHAR